MLRTLTAVLPRVGASKAQPRRHGRGVPLRWCLLYGNLLTMVPILAFAVIVVREHVATERAHIQSEARSLVRAMTAAVDRDLAQGISALQALATSPALASNDLAGFHVQAMALARTWGAGVALRSGPTGSTILLITHSPYGTALPAANLAGGRDLYSAGPYVSDLFTSSITNQMRLRITVEVPAASDTDEPRFLDLSFSPDRVLTALQSQEAPPNWIAIVADRNGRLLARNPGNEGFVGRVLPKLASANVREGINRTLSLVGVPVAGFFRRSDLSDWYVGISVPEAVLDAPLDRSIRWLVGIGVMLVLLAAWMSLLITRLVDRDVRRLSAIAAILGAGGGAVTGAATVIREMGAIQKAMAAAAANLRCNADAQQAALIEIQRERELLRSVLESSADGIIVQDSRGRCVLANTAAASVLQRPIDKLMGNSLKRIFPASARALLEAHDCAANQGHPAALEHEFQSPRNSAPRTLLFSFAPWQEPRQHAHLGVVCVVRDVTQRRNDEARLREVEQSLQHLARRATVGAMASGIAHELNQPLAAAATFLGGAQAWLPKDRERAEFGLQRAKEQVLRTGEILRRLRGFLSRGDAVRRSEAVAGIIQEAISLALTGSPDFPAGTVEFFADPALPPIVMDRIQVQQVMINLLRNAIEAMEDQSLELPRTLRVAVRNLPGSGAEVIVSDTGPGLPQDVAARLFEPFVSTKADGMGVGLSICRSIVEAHGGRISAESAPGGGTTFRFTLAQDGGHGVLAA